jgi:hypothetical protein
METEGTSFEEAASEESAEDVETLSEIVETRDVAPAAPDPAFEPTLAEPASDGEPHFENSINEEVGHVAID